MCPVSKSALYFAHFTDCCTDQSLCMDDPQIRVQPGEEGSRKFVEDCRQVSKRVWQGTCRVMHSCLAFLWSNHLPPAPTAMQLLDIPDDLDFDVVFHCREPFSGEHHQIVETPEEPPAMQTAEVPPPSDPSNSLGTGGNLSFRSLAAFDAAVVCAALASPASPPPDLPSLQGGMASALPPSGRGEEAGDLLPGCDSDPQSPRPQPEEQRRWSSSSDLDSGEGGSSHQSGGLSEETASPASRTAANRVTSSSGVGPGDNVTASNWWSSGRSFDVLSAAAGDGAPAGASSSVAMEQVARAMESMVRRVWKR